MKIKKGDFVQVIAGKDKGKKGNILQVDRAKNRVIVEGVKIATKHQKPNAANQNGGIVKTELSIHASNVMYVHKDKPTRLGYKIEEKEIEKDGKTKKVRIKKRIAKSTGEVID
ncbi:MAG: 50S ribosomal protein L24 [Defluviitaleaceae bacterium]|nr:50S ribosomal protein L24 [Defluviitaleaceae bacterium]